jgi:hypothetical protein
VADNKQDSSFRSPAKGNLFCYGSPVLGRIAPYKGTEQYVFLTSAREHRALFSRCVMKIFDVVLADIATLEAARDALPSHSHTAALFSLTLYRLEEEADALHRVALKRAA